MPPNIRVLVVDDKPEMRQAFTNLLYFEENLTVVGTAENGQEALEKISELTPDIVLMDIEMPVMNGLEATRQIRKTRPTLPVILMSSEARYRTEATLTGAVAYLMKPFTTEQVVETIQRILELPNTY